MWQVASILHNIANHSSFILDHSHEHASKVSRITILETDTHTTTTNPMYSLAESSILFKSGHFLTFCSLFNSLHYKPHSYHAVQFLLFKSPRNSMLLLQWA